MMNVPQSAEGPSTERSLVFMARFGYAARGVVYVIVGGIALAAAIQGGPAAGTRGALAKLLQQPAGQWLLGAVALGLVAYAMWRLLQSVMDADDHGTSAKGLAIRGGLFVSALTHLLLALFAASLIFGWGYELPGAGGGGGGGEDSGARNWTTWLMAKPFGQWLVGLVGAAVIGGGVAQLIKGYKAQFEKWLVIPPDRMALISPLCRLGLIARGMVFCIIGGFLVVAAWQYDANEARGLAGTLETLRRQPYGPWLLGAVAVGLLAFAAYSFVEAASRRIRAPERRPHGAPRASSGLIPSAK